MWTPAKTKKYGVAVYNWKGDVRYGLPLEIGETVQILEENSGWYRGFSTKNRAIKGIFPSSYIHLKPCRIENEGLFESVIPIEDPVLREVTQVLREWGLILKTLYMERENYKYTSVRKVMRELLERRRQLLTGTLTQDQTRELKLKITNKIDWGNRKLGLDLVPRIDSEMVDPAGMSVVELYEVHVQSSENSQSAITRGTLRQKVGKKILTHHLYMYVKAFGYCIGEEAEIYLSLYDSNSQKFLTDRYVIQVSKQGFSNYIDKFQTYCTVFTDLGNSDLKKDIYLVVQIMRIGKMVHNDSNRKSTDKTPQQCFKRPVGVAVLNISEILDVGIGSEEKEFTFKAFQGEEKDFFQLHELIIKKQTNKYSSLQGQPNYGIVVVFKMLHGELSQVREENPILFKNISLTKKLGFPDIILPGDVRNDLYITLDKGDFERGGKSTSKNIEVTVLVLDGDGKVLENCLWGACGADPESEYHSMIIYHHNSPHWNETIRLTVPIDKYYNAHVRFEFRHCSTREKVDNRKLFAFAFTRLMSSDGATLRDMTHELFIYKCDEKSKLNPEQYLRLPSNMQDTVEINSGTSPYSRSTKEVFYITTLLCSTKLTQNVDLLSLLKWKAHPERINETLGKVLKLGGEELVKFLQDVLDSLFAMFSTEDGNSTSHSGQVFHVLVSIFSLLEEGKFEHFKPVMDTYIKGHFAAALVYKGLLTSVKHCADFVHTSGNQEALQKCFRSLEYVFKFIIQSRLLFARATDGQYEKKFRDDLNSLFEALNIMLSKNNPSILNIQIAVLHGSSAVFEQLTQVLPTVEATRLAAAMLEALPNVRDLPPQLTQAKLTAIKNLVTSQLFYDDESRNMLLTVCSKHIKMHLAHRDELKLCSEILAEIIRYLFKQRQLQDQGKVNNCIHLDVEILSLNILDHLVHTLNVIMDSHSSILGSLVTCLMGLLQLMDEYHYKRFWEEFVERGTLRNLLLKVFAVFYDLTKKCVFPSDWLIMKMVVNNIILNSLQEFAQPLIFRFLKGQFDISIWSRYFNLAVSYLTQPSLQLERFSQVKREMIMEKYEDMRVLMGFQILSMWSNLRENKIHFIQSMVAPFLEVTLVPEPELRKATLHIFYDMIEVEQSQHGNFKNVENELIDKLDILISQENKGDDEYRQLFHTILLDKVQTEDPQWKESGKAFITSVTRLLERLLDYRSVIHGDENRDKRMHCTVNLLNFYKNEINRKEMYLRYIHRLHDLHLSAENFLEAGFTMKLYADQLTWTQRVLPGDDNYPVEEEWQRKVKLYDQIISYFDRGKAWEKGIPLCKELANLYETKLFDYQKLSSILQTQAKFFDNILTQLRPEPEYFRVGFYGLSFPLFVRNKLFVYRGLEYERIGAFTQRLQTEFPSAQILTKNTPPDDSIVNGDGQFIQISNVKPLSEGNVIFQGIAEVPEKIASYYEINDVKRFQLDRPVHKGPVDKDNEFKSLWIERTILVIAHPLPGILRWFEVTERSVELIPPVQFACETMEAMNRELKQLTAVYNAEPKRNINPFSMRLQGIIDANVMGGIAKYQQAFFSQEFAQNHSEYLPFVSKLKCLLNEQIDLLENALLLHGRLCSSEVQPLHKRLQERFLQLKASFKDFGSRSIINTPLPPVPVDGKKFGQHYDLYSNRYSNSMAAENLYEDGIYSKPAECSGNATPPIPHRKSSSSVGECSIHDRPPKPTHQRSLSKPLSPRTARHVISDDGSTVSLRNSWSEELRNDAEDAPPLPPRGLIPDSKRGPFLHDGQTPTVPPKRPLSQNQKSSSSIFYVDSVETPAEEEPIENHDGGSSSSTEVTMRNDIDKEDLRDSGCFIHDGRPETTSSFNNLSYEDFDLRSRMSVRNNFNIQFNGDGTNASATAEEKQLNTEEGSSPPPVPNPKPNAAVVPPPIPPKSLSLSERRESTENPGTPSASSVQNGGKNENYSVPRLQNQRQ